MTSRSCCAATARPSRCATPDNDIPDRAVEVLLDVTRENAPLFQRYFRLKAGWLGLKRLRSLRPLRAARPLGPGRPLSDAVRSVLQTFADFHPRFAKHSPSGVPPRPISTAKKSARGAGRGGLSAPPSCRVHAVGARPTSRPVRDGRDARPRARPRVHSMLAEHAFDPHAALFAPLGGKPPRCSRDADTDRLLREKRIP